MIGNEEAPVACRSILNANLGVTNIIERDAIRRDMGRVTDSIFDKLKAHYGPYSSFAALDPNKPLEDTVYTKDGYNIVKSIEFASPLEDWVRRAVAYVGKNIERSAGDGTTSSMMFACSMLKHMTATIDQIKPINYNQFRSAYLEFVKQIKERMEPFILSAKDASGKYDPKKVADLAYLQAYTSSHGNEELSRATSKLFERTPSDAWGKMQFKRRRYESDKLIELEESKHQYHMKAEIFSKTVYNKEVGRYLEYENATFIVICGSLHLEDVYWKTIKDEIEKSNKEHPLAILCFNDFDNATFGELMSLLSKKDDEGKPKYCFAVFSETPIHKKINDFTILQTVTGNNVLEYAEGEFAGRPCITRGVYVKYEYETLELDNLYKDDRPKTDAVQVRPYYTDSTKPYFREFADTIKKALDFYESADLDRNGQREYRSVLEMYLKLVYDKTINIVIGGNTFDNLAMYDVVDDVIRATIRSLENGMVVSNNKTLYQAACSVKSSCLNDKVIRWFADNVIATLNEFSDVVLDQLYPHGKATIKKFIPKKSFFSSLFHTDPLNDFLNPMHNGEFRYDYETEQIMIRAQYKFTAEERASFRSWWFENSVNMLNYDNTVFWDEQDIMHRSPMRHIGRHEYRKESMIVQPANADIVMLDRFGEIALKFILTERVIVSGSAYVNKETKK